MMLARLIATVVYVGYLRPAPGTWGSLAALPMAWLIHAIGGPALLVVSIIVGFIKGVWATSKVTEGREDHDPSEVVIDEVIGQWIALLPVSFGAWHTGSDILALWPGWVVAFLAFRAFDIVKPGPVGWADRRNDAFGVMLDDVIAGIFAAIVVIAIAALAHGMLIG